MNTMKKKYFPLKIVECSVYCATAILNDSGQGIIEDYIYQEEQC